MHLRQTNQGPNMLKDLVFQIKKLPYLLSIAVSFTQVKNLLFWHDKFQKLHQLLFNQFAVGLFCPIQT